MSYLYLLKLIMIGDSGVGKSTMLYRFINNEFIDFYDMTIGVDLGIKLLMIDNKPIKLHIWDTAGQEKYRSITRSYYKDVVGILLCYDVTNMQSFYNISDWLKSIKEITDSAVIILVGTKSDAINKRVVTTEDGEQLAKKHGLLFMEISAKNLTSSSVNDCFTTITQDIYNKIKNGSIDVNKKNIKTGLLYDNNDSKQNSCCC